MRHSISAVFAVLCLGGLWLAGEPFPSQLSAQAARKSKASPRDKKRPVADVSNIDVRAEKAQEQYIVEAEKLSREYLDAGHADKAKELLEGLLKVNPNLEGVKDRLKQLEEQMLTSNENQLEIEAIKGWQPAPVSVFKGRPFRVQAEGTYRMVVSTAVGPEGFSGSDILKDMAPELPCGALIGVVLKAAEGNRPPEPGKPFLLGASGEVTPPETGKLFLKVNAPPGNKNTGRLTVTLSGYLQRSGK